MNSFTQGSVKFFSQTENRAFIELIRLYKPFTDEEEKLVFRQYKDTNDLKIRDEIVLRNQRWVYSMAKQYARDEIEVMDYVSEGNIGLMEAIEKFDTDMEFKFITYAVWYIRRAMNSYMNNARDILQKSNNAKISKKVERIKNDFMLKKGRIPTIDELKDELKEQYDIVVVDDSDLYDLNVKSIHAMVDDDYELEESNLYNDKTSSVNDYLEVENKEYYKQLLMPLLNSLPKKNREIIMKLYHIGEDYDNYTVAQVCDEYGLYEDGLKEKEKKILQYMRQTFEEMQESRKMVG